MHLKSVIVLRSDPGEPWLSRPPHRCPKTGPPAVVSRRRMTPLRRLVYTLTAPLIVGLVRLMWWTYRFEIRGDGPLRELAAEGRPMVLAFWHGDLFMMPWYLSRLTDLGVGVTYLVSPSMDGEYAVRLLAVIGGRTVRGSATRSGTRAIRGLYRVVVKQRGSPVVAADGPRGPRHRCKKGPVVLAQLTGAKIAPLAAPRGGPSVCGPGTGCRFRCPSPALPSRSVSPSRCRRPSPRMKWSSIVAGSRPRSTNSVRGRRYRVGRA